jgi:hypothetical protein
MSAVSPPLRFDLSFFLRTSADKQAGPCFRTQFSLHSETAVFWSVTSGAGCGRKPVCLDFWRRYSLSRRGIEPDTLRTRFCPHISKDGIQFSGALFFWRYSPNLGLGLPPRNSPFHFGFPDLRQSVGLLGRVISSSQGLSTCTQTQKNSPTHTHTNTKLPCPEWDSNPRSRLPSEPRQFMP